MHIDSLSVGGDVGSDFKVNGFCSRVVKSFQCLCFSRVIQVMLMLESNVLQLSVV